MKWILNSSYSLSLLVMVLITIQCNSLPKVAYKDVLQKGPNMIYTSIILWLIHDISVNMQMTEHQNGFKSAVCAAPTEQFPNLNIRYLLYNIYFIVE